MRLQASRLTAIATLALLVSSCATLQTNPTPESIDATRAKAIQIAAQTDTAVTSIREVGKFLDTLPLSNQQKNDFDLLIVAAMGTSDAPGPLHLALETLRTVTSEPSLRTTATLIVEAVNPLIAKLEMSDNAGLRGFGVILRAGIAYALTLTVGGGL